MMSEDHDKKFWYHILITTIESDTLPLDDHMCDSFIGESPSEPGPHTDLCRYMSYVCVCMCLRTLM